MSKQLSHVIPSFDHRVIFSALEKLGCCVKQANFEHVVCIDEFTSASFSVQKTTPFCVYVSMTVMGAEPFDMELILYPAQETAKVASFSKQGEVKSLFQGYDVCWGLIEEVHIYLQGWLTKALAVVDSKGVKAST